MAKKISKEKKLKNPPSSSQASSDSEIVYIKNLTDKTTKIRPVLSNQPKKKVKAKYLDGGIGVRETEIIRNANRLLWQRSSSARKIVLKRCLLSDGHSKCELCNDIVIKVKVDHTNKVGKVDEGYLARLWCSSEDMKGMCDPCHNVKSKCEEASDILIESGEWEFILIGPFIRATNSIISKMKGKKGIKIVTYVSMMREEYAKECSEKEKRVSFPNGSTMDFDLDSPSGFSAQGICLNDIPEVLHHHFKEKAVEKIKPLELYDREPNYVTSEDIKRAKGLDPKKPIPGTIEEHYLEGIDLDIKEMDLYTHEKIKLQEKRNAEAAKFRLEDFI